MTRVRLQRFSSRFVVYVICALILLPLFLMAAVSFTETKYISFPPQGFTGRWYAVALGDAQLTAALGISLRVAIYSCVLSVAFGVIGAVALDRLGGGLERVLTAFFLAPLTVPLIVFSLGALFFFTQLGLVRTIAGLVIAHTVMTFPYSVRMIVSALARLPRDAERAASVLGAHPAKVFIKVTLPGIRAGVVAAALFAFLLSLNNVTVAVFIAGAETQTLPVVLFQLAKFEVTPTMAALGAMLVSVTIGFMVVLERRFGIYEVLERSRGA